MRRTIAFLTLAVLLLCSVSCNNYSKDERAIRKSAQSYLDAMGNYRLDDAAPYASRYTREETLPLFKRVMKYADTAYVNANQPAEIKLLSVRMLDDSAAMVYFHKHTPIKDVDDSVVVIYEDDQWLCEVRVKNIAFLPPEKEETNDATQ